MNIIITSNGNVKRVLRVGGRLVLQDYTAPNTVVHGYFVDRDSVFC